MALLKHPQDGFSYTTVFDKNYAARALVMIRTLLEHAPSSKIYALCCDDESFAAFNMLPEERIIPIDIRQAIGQYKELESSRTHTELMWTLSSFSFDVVFKLFPDEALVTYLDADLFFLKDPSSIVEQFSNSESGVLITRHDYSARLGHLEKKFGRFNVQFIPMKKIEGWPIRERWRAQCEKWCFARHEDGQFGDQKYLNEWPVLWGGLVSIWDKKGTFQGPWNAENFPTSEATCFHFSSLKILGKFKVMLALPGYSIPSLHMKHFYVRYLKALREATSTLRETGLALDPVAGFHVWIIARKNVLFHA